MVLEIFKIYIKTNLANSFIWRTKSFVGIFIFFVHKPNRNLRLDINYQSLNNLIIKNWYVLLLIDKLLDWLKLHKCFIYLDLISAYYWIKTKDGNK